MKKLILSSAQYDALYLLVYCADQIHQLKDNVRASMARKGYTADTLEWHGATIVTDAGRDALEHDQAVYHAEVYGEA